MNAKNSKKTANRFQQPSDSPSGSATNKGISVFGYTNYRQFLLDFYMEKKTGRGGYSYRNFAKSAGFKSPNFLKLVIEGHRSLTDDSLPKVLKALGMNGPKAEYFIALVKFNQTDSDEEKAVCYQTLQKLIPHSKKRQLGSEGLRYLSHWLHPTIREMALCQGFRDDPYWISRRLVFDATLNEVGEAIKFLCEEKFIQKMDKGYLTNDHMIISSDEVRSLAIRSYHRQMIEIAKTSLERLPMEQREFGALTLKIQENDLPELKNKLKAMRTELHEWCLQHSTKADPARSSEVVTQVNIQMFPLTKRVES